jgi:hypothetical protein
VNEKAIAITVFFASVFLLYQIRFILRFRKLRKINRNMNDSGFVLGAYFPICDCCNCLDCFLIPCCIIGEDSDEVYEVLQEKRAQRQSDEFERKSAERKIIEEKEYVAKIKREKIERQERLEALRVTGYVANERDRNKVIEIVSINPKTGLSWTSNATRLPVEEIVIIIELEPDFEIKDEYIINKKKMQEKEEKIKITKITCPNCENLFELGSDFCPNCGYEL